MAARGSRRSGRRQGFRGVIVRIPRRVWLGGLAVAFAGAAMLAGVLGYYWVEFGREIDARLHGERVRTVPRIYARPLELYAGQAISDRQLIDRLNDLGYAHRAQAGKPGEFAVNRDGVVLVPRDGTHTGRPVRVRFQTAARQRGAAEAPSRIAGLFAGDARVPRVTLDPPLLTALISTGREKRRRVPLAAIPPHMVQAVLAIEDHRFHDHLGIDPIRIVGALVNNISRRKPYLEGASTITQQLARNFFLTEQLAAEAAARRRSLDGLFLVKLKRKLLEQFMSIVLERRATKDEILELYLNDVYLGQRGSFAIHGVAEAARLFFGKDVANVTLAEAATIAGVIQSPPLLSPFNNPDRCRERRNTVLRAMTREGFVTAAAAARAADEPVAVVARALDAQAPYFVDLVAQSLEERAPGVLGAGAQLDVYTTLDVHLQRVAQDAIRGGLAEVDRLLARRRRQGQAQAALIAVDPRTGEVLALVGGRSYNQSQYNRAVMARRQPGSVFKPFVYLAAFELAAEEGRADLTPATLVADEPTTFLTDTEEEWTPGNYEHEYDGAITLRRALALSRNIGTIKVAERVGFGRVAALWDSLGVGSDARAYPSITLGVFEASPYEIATAYTIFPNGGLVRPLRLLARVVAGGESRVIPDEPARRVARPDTTYLVTDMMRSVLSEGTGASARARGFALDAAGKSGTTNDLRDAWFVGFTPELLTVVWVGIDSNQPLGLSGTQAALPIWTDFMMRALAGHADQRFAEPDGIVHVEIDRDTGQLATPLCPRVLQEAFLSGTEPMLVCEIHR